MKISYKVMRKIFDLFMNLNMSACIYVSVCTKHLLIYWLIRFIAYNNHKFHINIDVVHLFVAGNVF